MPRASAQSSLDAPKPPRGRRIKEGMQASTQPSANGRDFTAVHATREFDLWLQRELGRLHGDVMHEPIPEKLLRIIEEGIRPRD
jgi:hypothetical protein